MVKVVASGVIGFIFTLTMAIAASGSVRAEENKKEKPISELIENFYAGVEHRYFYAPKQLTWMFEPYQNDVRIETGVTYLTGEGVPQDMERAAIILGAALFLSGDGKRWMNGSVRAPLPENLSSAIGHAAHTTAIKYAELAVSGDSKAIALERSFLKIAYSAGHQATILREAYKSRMKRMDERLNAEIRYAQSSWEVEHFKNASVCTEANMNRPVIPWKSELCSQAANEIAEAKAAKTIAAAKARKEDVKHLNPKRVDEHNWGLVAVAGIVALFAASINAEGYSGVTDAHRLQAEQARANRSMESTWAHVGAAMFVP